MTEIWAQAAVWLGLALLATLVSIRLRIATALSEIVVGTIAQLILGAIIGGALLDADASWVKFLSGAGAIVLTFLAGAELDPAVFRAKWKEATAVGLVSFAAPFLGCAAVAYWGLGWSAPASWLAGIAMSTTSVAVVYAVMLEFGFNETDYGKTVLAACFITDLGTVRRAGLHLRAVHLQDARLRGGERRGVRRPALDHAALLPPLRRPALGAGGEVPDARVCSGSVRSPLGRTARRCCRPT